MIATTNWTRLGSTGTPVRVTVNDVDTVIGIGTIGRWPAMKVATG